MFSKELEEVIETTLADGVITEKKRAMLHKLAQVEGVDADTLDIVIDGKLSKINNGIAANKSAAELANRLKEIEEKYAKQTTDLHKDSTEKRIWESKARREIRDESEYRLLQQTEENRTKEIYNTILNFPTPTTREDLLDFILVLQPKSEKGGADDMEIVKAYRTKYHECINKAKFLFSNDPQFQSLFKQYDKDKRNKKIIKIIKILISLGIVFIIGIIVLLIVEEMEWYS